MIFLAIFGTVSCLFVIPLFFFLLGVKTERKKWNRTMSKGLDNYPPILTVNDIIKNMKKYHEE